MRRLARRLGIEVAESTWPGLVDAARFEQMKARADDLAPDPVGCSRTGAGSSARAHQVRVAPDYLATSTATTSVVPNSWHPSTCWHGSTAMGADEFARRAVG